MKILHLNSYFSTSGLFSEFYDRQVQAGLDIQVYVPISYQYDEAKIAATGDYTLIKRNHHYLDRFFFHYKYHKIYQDLKTSYDLKVFDLVHAHSLFSNGYLAYRVWQDFGIPYMVAVRSADIRTFFQKMPWLRGLGLKILKEAQHIVFISRNGYQEVLDLYIPDDFKDAFITKASVIANGVNPFWLTHTYQTKSRQVQAPIQVVTVGKTLYEKRFVELANLLADYNATQACHLHVVGPNWDQKIVDQLQAHPLVTYHGPMGKEDLLAFFRQMDVFALLSSRETFGLVYVEAMTQGLPVLYTQGEGFDGYFPDGHIGSSINLQEASSFQEGLDHVLNHYEELVQNALDESQQFNWDSITAQYSNLYNQLLTQFSKKENYHEKS